MPSRSAKGIHHANRTSATVLGRRRPRVRLEDAGDENRSRRPCQGTRCPQGAARLGAARSGKRAARLEGERQAIEGEREEVRAARASVDQDLATIRADRENLLAEQIRSQDAANDLAVR